MGKEITGDFTLPNEKIIVKYIKRKIGMAANVEEGHVMSGGMLVNSVRKFSAPLQMNGAIKNVLTKEEKEYLESVTDLKLSVYGDFWERYQVSLFKEDANNSFDLSDPMDYISYKILSSLKEIAPDWASRDKNLTYQFAITRVDEEMRENKSKYDSKKEAFKLYGKIEDDKDKLLGVLKLLSNTPISQDTSLEWLQHKIEEYVDTMPSAFINVINDKSFYTKMLLNSAVDKGVVIKRGNKYTTSDGLDLCDSGEIPTFDNAVRYLDNPKHQEVRTIIEAKISKVK